MTLDLNLRRAGLMVLAGALAASLAATAAAQEPIVTGGSDLRREGADELRLREAIAYAYELPRGAPQADYPLVAWCEALVLGHVALGETLTDADPLDRDIIRLGRLEAADFRAALDRGASRQTPGTLQASREAAAEAQAKWSGLLENSDEAVRSQAFGLFFGLPGRCEHAARRVRDNITSAPAALDDVAPAT